MQPSSNPRKIATQFRGLHAMSAVAASRTETPKKTEPARSAGSGTCPPQTKAAPKARR